MRTKPHTLRYVLMLTAIATALAVPAASAMPVDQLDTSSSGPVNPAAYSVPPAEQSPAEPTTALSDGFDWGDAGIGAVAILALAAIGAGAAMTLGHRSRAAGPQTEVGTR